MTYDEARAIIDPQMDAMGKLLEGPEISTEARSEFKQRARFVIDTMQGFLAAKGDDDEHAVAMRAIGEVLRQRLDELPD